MRLSRAVLALRLKLASSPAACTIALWSLPLVISRVKLIRALASKAFALWITPFRRLPPMSWSGCAVIGWKRRTRTLALSEPKQPIVYYLDAAVPEPTRSAMKDGFLWWNKAFEAAGFKNALQIRDTPPDMDPMDVRYNQIYWVDRDERGYSTGGGLTDPRTGEILAARVRLESDRVRTVSRYWQTYEPPIGGGGNSGSDFEEGFFEPGLPPYSTPETEQQLVLLRQALLTAHETGHTLGFDHNWNSSMNDRASVMEYPSPRIKIVNGKIDLTDAYQKQIGAYDIMTVRYAYTEFPPAQEKAGLDNIIKDMRKQGLMFTPATDPRWNRYDDGSDPAEYMRQAAAQRKILLANYGPAVLKDGEPYGNLRGIRLWMTYLHHRWSIDSGVRYVGGMYTNFAVKGETLPPTEIVPAAKQREILGLLLDDVDPANLAIPEPAARQPYRRRGTWCYWRTRRSRPRSGEYGILHRLRIRSPGSGPHHRRSCVRSTVRTRNRRSPDRFRRPASERAYSSRNH